MIIFTSDRTETFSGWSRSVYVDGQEYSVSVKRGKAVRIPYKRRGHNRGWQWHGSVYRITKNHGHVWTGRVNGSIGCRGLLVEAGVLPTPPAIAHKRPPTQPEQPT
jgi:hypothetical protein